MHLGETEIKEKRINGVMGALTEKASEENSSNTKKWGKDKKICGNEASNSQ